MLSPGRGRQSAATPLPENAATHDFDRGEVEDEVGEGVVRSACYTVGSKRLHFLCSLTLPSHLHRLGASDWPVIADGVVHHPPPSSSSHSREAEEGGA